MKNNNQKPNRVLLKISGEALMGNQKFGLDQSTLDYVVNEVKKVQEQGIQIGIVVGGGNIFRGVSTQAASFPRTIGDTIGMLATVMNSLALGAHFNNKGLKARTMSAFSIGNLVEGFSVSKAQEYMENGEVVVFGGGTSNPYFTTDTAAVLRALEIQADIMVKATKVDGIYDSDPQINVNAKFINEITYDKVLEKNLRVMDGAAVAIARDNKLPLLVLNLKEENAMVNGLTGQNIGSKVIP
jgi:uridylate kinase